MPSPVARLLWGAAAGAMFTVFCVWTAALEIAGRLRAWNEAR